MGARGFSEGTTYNKVTIPLIDNILLTLILILLSNALPVGVCQVAITNQAESACQRACTLCKCNPPIEVNKTIPTSRMVTLLLLLMLESYWAKLGPFLTGTNFLVINIR